MRTPRPLLLAFGALALSLVPAAAPASPAVVLPGALHGNWTLTCHAKSFPANGEKPYHQTFKLAAAITDPSVSGVSMLTMTATFAGGAVLTFNGFRVGKHFLLTASGFPVEGYLSGDAVISKATGMAKSFKARGTLVGGNDISELTITGKYLTP